MLLVIGISPSKSHTAVNIENYQLLLYFWALALRCLALLCLGSLCIALQTLAECRAACSARAVPYLEAFDLPLNSPTTPYWTKVMYLRALGSFCFWMCVGGLVVSWRDRQPVVQVDRSRRRCVDGISWIRISRLRASKLPPKAQTKYSAVSNQKWHFKHFD